MGEHALGKLLVLSQVVLSLQLPFVLLPLTRITGDKAVMGVFTNSALTKIGAWGLFLVITTANIVLLVDLVRGG